jgi:hypothetical protein
MTRSLPHKFWPATGDTTVSGFAASPVGILDLNHWGLFLALSNAKIHKTVPFLPLNLCYTHIRSHPNLHLPNLPLPLAESPPSYPTKTPSSIHCTTTTHTHPPT